MRVGSTPVRRNNAVARGGELRLLFPRGLGGDEGIGAGSFAVARPLPPFQEIAALGMELIPARDADMVAAHPALAVEQSGGKNPAVVDFDFLEEPDARRSGHLAVLA